MSKLFEEEQREATKTALKLRSFGIRPFSEYSNEQVSKLPPTRVNQIIATRVKITDKMSFKLQAFIRNVRKKWFAKEKEENQEIIRNEQEQKKKETTKVIPRAARKGITSEIAQFYTHKINEGVYSRKELRELGIAEFPLNTGTAQTVLSRGFSSKVSQFHSILVEVDGIVRFEN